MNPAEALILLGGTSAASGSSSSGVAAGTLDFSAASQSGLFVVIFL